MKEKKKPTTHNSHLCKVSTVLYLESHFSAPFRVAAADILYS